MNSPTGRFRAGATLLGALAVLAGGIGCEGSMEPATSAEVVLTVVAGGDPQVAAVGNPVPIRPSVRVTDGAGRPLAGRRVVFHPTLGGGEITLAPSPLTDADGVATVGTWLVGQVAGPQELTAAVADATVDTRVTFPATAVAGAPTSLDVGALHRPLAVGDTQTIAAILRDQFGNIVTSGAAATFVPSAPAVATVSPAGVVSALAGGGTMVRVTRGGFTRDLFVGVGSPSPNLTRTVTDLATATFGVGVSPADVAYVTSSDNANVRRFDLPTETAGASVASTGQSLDVAFLPDGTRAYVARQGASTVTIVDVATNTALRSVGVPGEAQRVVASPDGMYVYVSTNIGRLIRIHTGTDATTVLNLGVVFGVASLNGMVLHPTRNVLFVTGRNGELMEVDLTTYTQTSTRNIGGQLQGITLSADRSRLFITRESGALEVRNSVTLELLTSVTGLSDNFDVAATPDGRYLILAVATPLATRVVVADANTFAIHQSFVTPMPRRIARNAAGTLYLVTTDAGQVQFLK